MRLLLRTTPIISQGDLLVKHFFKKNKKERELFFPLLSLKSHNLKTEIQKKINQKQFGVPLLKQPIGAERLNVVNVWNIRGFVGEYRAQNSKNLFHFYSSFLLGFVCPLMI